MRIKNLADLIESGTIESLKNNCGCEITGIQYNSKKVVAGNMFIAVRGSHTDGHNYIEAALEKKAICIVHEDDLKEYRDNVCYIKVKDSRKALSYYSAAFYDFPCQKLKTIGVTGTNGKSTTVWFIQQLIELSGKKSGFISTVNYQVDKEIAANPFRQSTPESLEINDLLDQMFQAGKEYAVIESTSHGLSGKTSRLADIRFDAATLTNITHEHLEFHGTMEQYIFDKANLFRQLKNSNAFAIINKDDPAFQYISGICTSSFYTYSLKDNSADLKAGILNMNLDGIDFQFSYKNKTFKSRLNMPGLFNIENLMAAIMTVSLVTGIEIENLIKLSSKLTSATGRIKSIKAGQPFYVIVDYAHAPDSFEKIFSMLRPYCPAKLISVFGSAGQRDTIKRPIQGEIASRFCDIVILTDEDPRNENSMSILEDIAKGCKNMQRGENLFLIPDRREALHFAFSLASKADTVIALGKGHESSIIYPHGPIPWNEIEVCENLLKEMFK